MDPNAPVENVIERLVYHGCPDVSDALAYCETRPYSQGGFGDVYRGSLHDGTKVALKCLRSYIAESKQNRKALKHAARELYTWSQCQHPNVVKLLGLVEFRGQLAMVSPWMELGGINCLSRTGRQIDRCRLCAQITKGLAYLHRKGIVHGDLKGANVLLSNDNVAQLADFGNAVIESSVLTFTESSTPGCSARWAAPEQLEGQVPCSFEADVYSLGMTILEVISKQLPFAHIGSLAAVTTAVLQRQVPKRPESAIPTTSEQGDILWRLLMECWIGEPERRPNILYVKRIMKGIKAEGLALHRPGYPPSCRGPADYTQDRDSSRSARQMARERMRETETEGRSRSGGQPWNGYYTG